MFTETTVRSVTYLIIAPAWMVGIERRRRDVPRSARKLDRPPHPSQGDIRHSVTDLTAARTACGYDHRTALVVGLCEYRTRSRQDAVTSKHG